MNQHTVVGQVHLALVYCSNRLRILAYGSLNAIPGETSGAAAMRPIGSFTNPLTLITVPMGTGPKSHVRPYTAFVR